MKIKNKTIASVSKVKGKFDKLHPDEGLHRIDFTDGSYLTVKSAKYNPPPEGETCDFEPDWASKPGDTILELMEEKGVSAEELASRMGYKLVFIQELLDGKQFINNELADELAAAVGGTSQFWMNRERIYRDALVRLAKIY